jgi:hypothetical protein
MNSLFTASVLGSALMSARALEDRTVSRTTVRSAMPRCRIWLSARHASGSCSMVARVSSSTELKASWATARISESRSGKRR